MFGQGLLKGLGVTLKHFWEADHDDRKKVASRYQDSIQVGKYQRIMDQPLSQEGIFTIQYPEERRLLPERFRYIPMLIWDTETGEDRCTACGICAKVCPPQCIWIVRDADENGKPVTRPAEFYIDAAVCMSCSFCTEFCPFDAIKMNHDYELAVYDRYPQLVYDKAELTVPLEYYAALWPTQFAEEQERRKKEAEEAKARDEAKAKAAAEKAAAKAAGEAASPAAGKPQRTPEELAAMKQAAAAAAAARKEGAAAGPVEEPAAPAAEATTDAEAAKKARLEELKRQAAEKAKARKAATGDAPQA
jgi:NADH-quinone oxidoreductase subunit I